MGETTYASLHVLDAGIVNPSRVEVVWFGF
jgi:hypothetical protein